jgi:phage FluMu gp28-like protein
VLEVMLSLGWYRDNMGQFVGLFEDDMMDIPRDSEHESDLRDLERIDGIIKLPKEATENEDGVARHGDYAIALALANFATSQAPTCATDGYLGVPRHARGGKASADDRDNEGYQSRRM